VKGLKMKQLLVAIIALFVIGCSGSGGSDGENQIISHEFRNIYGEIVESIGGCEYLTLRLNFHVYDANLKQLCGYFYPEYHYGTKHELVCFDLYPSSVGKTLEWEDGLYPGNCHIQFTDEWDLWIDVWLVYGSGKVSPVYTAFIDVE
jgi:hypothetical protein